MNFKDTLEFAASISAHAQHLFAPHSIISNTALGYYWTLQKSWLNRKQTQFIDLADALAELPRDKELQVAMTLAMSEIIGGELILRTWASILTIKDQLTGRSEFGPIARNLFSSQLELRRRYLAMLLDENLPVEDFVLPIDRQRRRGESWTNFICGHLIAEYDVADFVHHEADARTYDIEHLYYLLSREIPRHDERREFAMSALEYLIASDIFPERTTPPGLPEVCGSILNCFPHTAFNDYGMFRPIRTTPDKHQRILQIGVKL